MGRILPFDDKAGLIWAVLMAQGKSRDRPRRGLDMIIASVADANDCVAVTDNETDFAELQIAPPTGGRSVMRQMKECLGGKEG